MQDNFTGQLKSLGLKSGDVIMMHSSMKALDTKRSPVELINDIISVIGTEGTLLIPALTYDNVRADKPRFSVSSTEPCIGLIPRTFFKMEGVIRSKHPTHSVCAFGKYAAEMTGDHHLDETPAGPNSPFMKMPIYKGKLLFIGDVVHCCTLMHGIEEIVKAPYTLKKEPTHYIIEDGASVFEKDFYDHDFEGIKQEYQIIRDILQYPDIRNGKVGEADCFLIDTKALIEKAIEKFKDNIYYFVSFKT